MDNEKRETDLVTPEELDMFFDDEEENTESAKEKKFNWKRELLDWAQAIIIALVVALLIKNFVFTLVQVDGDSMLPTLQNSNRLYVNRFMYTPEKGDIVIFKPVDDPKRPYIKRVIATEGDTIYIDYETSTVYVNDEPIDEPYIKEPTRLVGAHITRLMNTGNYSRQQPIIVEKDKVFVMGDNRNHSRDSREIGLVDKKQIIGGAVFRFWPLNEFGFLDIETTTEMTD